MSDFCFSKGFFAPLFLGCLCIVILFFSLFRYRKKTLTGMWSLGSLQNILNTRNPWVFWLQVVCLTTAWGLLTVALMDPQGNRHYLGGEKAEESIASRHLVFMIDASLSMGIKDMRGGISRLDFAKEVAQDISDAFPKDPVTLYAFTSVLTPLVPATFDHLFFQFRLDGMGLNEGDVGGTDLLEALRKLSLEEATSEKGILMILSDGGDRSFETGGKQERLEDIKAFLKKSSFRDWSVEVFGIGSKEGGIVPRLTEVVREPIVEEPLTTIVYALKGKYVAVNDQPPTQIAKESINWIKERGSLQNRLGQTGYVVFDHYFQIPLALAFCLLLLTRMRPALFVLSFLSMPLFSTPEDSLISSRRFMEAGEYGFAASELQKELDSPLSSWERAVVSYNLGLVLMRDQQPEKALQAFTFAAAFVTPPFYWFEENRQMGLSDVYLQLGFIERSKRALDKAIQADCLLQKQLGVSDCYLSRMLERRQEEVQQALSTQAKGMTLKKAPVEEQNVDYSSPISVLASSISALQAAINLQKQDQVPTDKELQDAEKKALSLINAFPNTALAYQQNIHQKEPGLCLRLPWDEVFPLVEEGQLFADQALQDMQNIGLFFQDKALNRWQKALELLQKKANPTSEKANTELLQRLKEMDIMDHKMSKKIKEIQKEAEW